MGEVEKFFRPERRPTRRSHRLRLGQPILLFVWGGGDSVGAVSPRREQHQQVPDADRLIFIEVDDAADQSPALDEYLEIALVHLITAIKVQAPFGARSPHEGVGPAVHPWS